jgi:hypothetical protein
MKKNVLVILLFVVLLITGIYIFIPATLNISEPIVLQSTEKGTTRLLTDAAQWDKWNTNKTSYTHRVVAQSFNPIQVLTIIGKDTVAGTIIIMPLQKDSVAVVWQCAIQSGSWPLQKLSSYRRAGTIKQDMENILASLRSYVEKPENVYHIRIRNEKVKDTLLMTTKTITTGEPAITTIYSLVSKLKNYIAAEGAKETNYPMLHIRRIDSSQFETMVAIPIDEALKGNQDIFLRRMVPGNILITDVKGGKYTISKALRSLETYMDDYQKASPAIPFESLVTDRSKETDTSKWITRLYYPVL